MADVTQRVIQVVARELRTSESSITSDSKFQEDLGADSLTLTRLGMALETEFGCTVLDDDAELIVTVGGMVTYIEGRLAA